MLIAAAQEFRLLGAAVVPYGTDGTNDLASWETIRAGNTGFSREATAELPTLTEQLRSRRPVEGAVNASAAEQRRIGGIDDRVMSPRWDSIFKAVRTCFV